MPRPSGPLLVTGFGPFPSVRENPSGALALALHEPDGEPPIHGLLLPVSYARGPALAIEEARRLDARLVLGIGVAAQRATAALERIGRRRLSPQHEDVDGVCAQEVGPEGPAELRASLDIERLAGLLGCEISEDAGAYVCNAWLYEVVHALGDRVPVGFLHIPLEGLPPERLRRALSAFVREEEGA